LDFGSSSPKENLIVGVLRRISSSFAIAEIHSSYASEDFIFVNLFFLDYFVKHTLKEPCYLRFGDDCTILSRRNLQESENEIKTYVNKSLTLTLHPQKTRHTTPERGVNLLGYKIFYYHKRIRNKNIERFKENLKSLEEEYALGRITPEKLTQKMRGWVEYARYAP
jgi:hypothetical protein